MMIMVYLRAKSAPNIQCSSLMTSFIVIDTPHTYTHKKTFYLPKAKAPSDPLRQKPYGRHTLFAFPSEHQRSNLDSERRHTNTHNEQEHTHHLKMINDREHRI